MVPRDTQGGGRSSHTPAQGLTRTTFDLSLDLHRWLKTQALRERIPMREVLQRALEKERKALAGELGAVSEKTILAGHISELAPGTLVVESDASYRDGRAGLGTVITEKDGTMLAEHSTCVPATTCSEAEAQAAREGVHVARDVREGASILVLTDNIAAVYAVRDLGDPSVDALFVRRQFVSRADRLAALARGGQRNPPPAPALRVSDPVGTGPAGGPLAETITRVLVRHGRDNSMAKAVRSRIDKQGLSQAIALASRDLAGLERVTNVKGRRKARKGARKGARRVRTILTLLLEIQREAEAVSQNVAKAA